MNINFAIELFIQTEFLPTGSDITQGSLGRLSHHFTQLAGHSQFTLTWNDRDLNSQEFATNLGPC